MKGCKIVTEAIVYGILLIFLGYCLMPHVTFFYSDECRLILMLLLILLIFVNFADITSTSSKYMLLLMSLVALGLILIMLNGSTMGPLVSLIQFLTCIIIFTSIDISKRQYIVIMLIVATMWVVFAINASTVWENYINGVGGTYNPNSLGLGLLLSYMLISLSMLRKIRKNRGRILFFLIFSSVSIYFVSLTQCRTALATALCFPIFILCKEWIYKFRILLLSVVIIAGSLFPIIYVNMYENGVRIQTSVLSEKSIYSGRQGLWKDALEHIDSSNLGWLMGVNDSSLDYTLTASNLHNWYLSIYFSFGIPFAIIYFAFYAYVVRRICSRDIFLMILALSAIGCLEVCAGSRNITQVFLFICFMLQCYDGNRKMEIASESRGYKVKGLLL